MKSTTAALAAAFLSSSAFALESDQLDPGGLAGNRPMSSASVNSRGFRSRIGQGHTNSGTPFLDTIPNWNGHFQANGVDQFGGQQVIWYYNMVGNRPELGGTTIISAPIIPVDVDLRNFDGSPRFVGGQRLYSPAGPFVAPTVNSPIFQNTTYSSSPVPTQYADAIQRAEFNHSAKDDWHTLLKPSVKTTRVMTLIRGTYRFALNSDGSCCFFVLVDIDTFIGKLFPSTFPVDASTVIGAAELAGEMTNTDITSLLFPNTLLYFNGNPKDCCVVGFHSFDFEPIGNVGLGQAFVMNYASWVKHGTFGGGAFEDVTALSHEMSELFNDPLVSFDGVHNITPWWEAPNGNCQDNLEDGDVIEGLPNATYTATLNGFTYHPQNEALLPWFAFDPNSTAIDGAYSYPDETVLTSPPAPQNPLCK
jgi:hypothetical protein